MFLRLCHWVGPPVRPPPSTHFPLYSCFSVISSGSRIMFNQKAAVRRNTFKIGTGVIEYSLRRFSSLLPTTWRKSKLYTLVDLILIFSPVRPGTPEYTGVAHVRLSKCSVLLKQTSPSLKGPAPALPHLLFTSAPRRARRRPCPTGLRVPRRLA